VLSLGGDLLGSLCQWHKLQQGKDVKKLLAALTLALLCSVALAVSAANATHSEGTGPNQDFVSGTGEFQLRFEVGLTTIHVNARSGPSGRMRKDSSLLGGAEI
jgi:hypothetical protein